MGRNYSHVIISARPPVASCRRALWAARAASRPGHLSLGAPAPHARARPSTRPRQVSAAPATGAQNVESNQLGAGAHLTPDFTRAPSCGPHRRPAPRGWRGQRRCAGVAARPSAISKIDDVPLILDSFALSPRRHYFDTGQLALGRCLLFKWRLAPAAVALRRCRKWRQLLPAGRVYSHTWAIGGLASVVALVVGVVSGAGAAGRPSGAPRPSTSCHPPAAGRDLHLHGAAIDQWGARNPGPFITRDSYSASGA